MNCNPFIEDAELAPYIRALRCRVPRNYTKPVTMNATVSEKGCTMSVMDEEYVATTTGSGLFIVDVPELYAVVSPPPAGKVIQQPSIEIHPARIEYIATSDAPVTDTTICIKTPIKCYFDIGKLTIDLADMDTRLDVDKNSPGIQTINGLIPDSFGNIVIRSVSPSVTITVDKG